MSSNPQTQSNKFTFFSTGSADLLMKGIEVELDMNFNPQQCKEFLKNKLQGHINDISKMDLIIYLSGGIPFLGGTLEDLYKSDLNPKFNIYGVLTCPFPDQLLNEKEYNLCNIQDDLHKKLISPISDSTITGLCNMACLLGYINNSGTKSEKLIRSSATLIGFPPLITSLQRIFDRNSVTNRDIITVSSTFYTYFDYIISPKVQSDKIFEYALKCCNMMTQIENVPEQLQLLSLDIQKQQPNNKVINLLVKLKQPPYVYFWKVDTDYEFDYCDLEPFDPTQIDDENNKNLLTFSPIKPLSIRFVNGCSIVKGKDHNYLYLSISSIKGTTDLVEIIDPIEGKGRTVNLDDFAKTQGDENPENSANLIDSDRVEQIIMVCFDQSGSMRQNLEGEKIDDKPEIPSRLTIAIQYLTSFANKFYAYRSPCILGLVSFNMGLYYPCPLSPLIPDFEDKGLMELMPFGKSRLWDAISISCDYLNKFCIDENNKQIFPNAKKRILVISDGEDIGSKTKSTDIAKKLMDNKIILDSVIISSEEICKELAVISHISGGVALNPDDINKGLYFFELSAFQNVKERKQSLIPIIKNDRKTIPKKLKTDMITPEFIKKAIECVEFDTEIINPKLNQAKDNTKLSTTEHICCTCKEEIFDNPRQRRILRELHYSSLVMDQKNEAYDPDLVIYASSTNFDVWQAYIKAPDNSPYEGKWFFILVNFPAQYPFEAPVFRFISIPYNLNISREGRICFEILEKGYISSFHVVDILQQIKEIFLMPRIEWAISIEILGTFRDDVNEYNRLAHESAINVGKDDYKDFFPKNIDIQDNVDDNYKLTFDGFKDVPNYMVSQISGRVYKDPVIPPSCGQVYEREELKQIVAQNSNPVCYITGLPIKESLEEIDQLKTVPRSKLPNL